MKKTPIHKAEENLQKAKDILSNTPVIYSDFYNDIKSIQKAGRLAWKGCVNALEYVLFYKNEHTFDNYIDPYDKQAYMDLLYKIDDKIVVVYESAYILLNFAMICDKTQSVVVCNDAINCAEQLINWCKKMEYGIEQYKKEVERANAERLKKEKEQEKIDKKIAKKQYKELLELLLLKKDLTKKDLIEFAYRDFIIRNVHILTTEEKKRFDHLVID